MNRIKNPNVIYCPINFVDDRCDLQELLNLASQFNWQGILLEGGSTLATEFLRQNLVDRVDIVVTPWISGSGTPAWKNIQPSYKPSLRLKNVNHRKLGEDILVSGLLKDLY
jgi:riboflavin biosynthesis pyrimidine reductase